MHIYIQNYNSYYTLHPNISFTCDLCVYCLSDTNLNDLKLHLPNQLKTKLPFLFISLMGISRSPQIKTM